MGALAMFLFKEDMFMNMLLSASFMLSSLLVLSLLFALALKLNCCCLLDTSGVSVSW
jgi:hypothetical protein